MILLRPWWLLALLPLALLALWVWRRQSAGAWEAIITPALLLRMRALGFVSPAARRGLVLLPFLAAGIVVVGLSGPARLKAGMGQDRMDPIILMLDMSPSVARAGQLADAQAAAGLVLQNAAGRPVGMMVYAADAYVASAPTSDAASLQSLVAVLGPETMPITGSRPDIALGAAHDLFASPERPDIGGADLILISDGGGAGPRAMQEAGRLREAGARLWTLGLSGDAAEGAPPPDVEALVRLAEAGGGAFAPARSPRPVLERIAAAQTGRLARSSFAPLVFDDLGRWLMALALLPALLLFRRRATGVR